MKKIELIDKLKEGYYIMVSWDRHYLLSNKGKIITSIRCDTFCNLLKEKVIENYYPKFSKGDYYRNYYKIKE